MEELLKIIQEDVDLRNELMNLWKEGASAEKIAEFLSKKGLQIGKQQVEELLSGLQKSKAKELTSMELDDDELEKVAGGQTVREWVQEENCSDQFVYSNNENSMGDACSLGQYCDDYFHCIATSAV